MADIDTRPKYDKKQFNEQFVKIISYFRAKLAPDVTVLYYNRVCPYPLCALEFAISRWIDSHKPTAGQMPTPNDLANDCATWLDDHPDVKFQYMRFDPIEDFEYPLEKLFTATTVLMAGDEHKFNEFCRANRMPKNDIERVRMKVGAIKNRNPETVIKKLAKNIGS